MPIGPKITENHYTLDELHRALRELGNYWICDKVDEAVRQCAKNRIYDEAMKAHDSRPDLRDA